MSDQDESVDAPAFIRQRRNIILASLVLAFAQHTHLTIEHVNFFGASAHIDSPVATTPYLWALCGYFLWRYWQAFRAVARKSTRDRYKEIKKVFVEPAAVHQALAPYRGINPPLVPNDATIAKGWMPGDEETPTAQGATVTIVTNILGDPHAGQKNVNVELSRAQLRNAKAKTVLHLALTSNELTEYYLPFAIVALPVGIWLAQFCQK